LSQPVVFADTKHGGHQGDTASLRIRVELLRIDRAEEVLGKKGPLCSLSRARIGMEKESQG
jgi:hypothetical protein